MKFLFARLFFLPLTINVSYVLSLQKRQSTDQTVSEFILVTPTLVECENATFTFNGGDSDQTYWLGIREDLAAAQSEAKWASLAMVQGPGGYSGMVYWPAGSTVRLLLFMSESDPQPIRSEQTTVMEGLRTDCRTPEAAFQLEQVQSVAKRAPLRIFLLVIFLGIFVVVLIAIGLRYNHLRNLKPAPYNPVLETHQTDWAYAAEPKSSIPLTWSGADDKKILETA